MILKLFHVFLFGHICLSATLSTTEDETNGTNIEKRFNKGPIDKGTFYETDDGAILVMVPPAHFCGNEMLHSVPKRENPRATYDVQLSDYVSELGKADPLTRRTMVINALNTAKGGLSGVCSDLLGGNPSRDLLAQVPGQPDYANRGWVATIIKSLVNGLTSYAVNYAFTKFPNFTSNPHIRPGGTGTAVAINVFTTKIIHDLNEKDRLTLKQFDQWKAAALTMLSEVMYQEVKWTNNDIGDGQSCKEKSFQNEQDAVNNLPNADGGNEVNIRPVSDVEMIRAQPNPNACPQVPLEAGNSGEAVV